MSYQHERGLHSGLTFRLFYFIFCPILISLLIHGLFFWQAGRTRLHIDPSIKKQTQRSVMLVEVKKKEKEPPQLRKAIEKQKLQPIRQNREWSEAKTFIPHPPSPKSITPIRSAMPKTTPPSAVAGKGNLKILTSTPAAQLPSAWLKIDTTLPGSDFSSGLSKSADEKSPGTYGEYVQTLRERGLDVVIVLDSTSSMDVVINHMKLKIESLILAIRKLEPICRVGIVTFRDHGDAYLTRTLPLTYNIPEVKNFLNSIQAAGGGDVPEAVEEGLWIAIKDMKWNSSSRSFILLIGDAPPHDKDMARTLAMAAAFRKKRGGCVSALDILTNHVYQENTASGKTVEVDREKVLPAFVAIAKAGGGEAGRLVTEEAIARGMLLYIFGTKWEAYLTELMREL